MSYETIPIQDRVDIDNLFSAYAYLLDDDDANGWIALYTEDGVFDVLGLNRFEGPEGLRAIANIVIEGSQGNWRHMATNVLVTPGASGDEVAVRSRTLLTDWNVDPAGTQFNDYRGTLVRINGHWRIKELIATPMKIIVHGASKALHRRRPHYPESHADLFKRRRIGYSLPIENTVPQGTTKR